MISKVQNERRYDIDWIRDITVLSVIFFHSLIIFFTRESAIMYVRSGDDVEFCIIVERIMSRYMMPLLFLLAGLSVRFSLRSRSVREFISNRVKKLLLPFVIGSVTLNPIVSYLYGRSQGRTISFAEHWIKFVTSISEDFNSLTTGYGPMHLWFILYLFIFSLICLPLFLKFQNQKMKENLSPMITRLVLLISVIPYMLIFKIDIMDEMNPVAYLYLFIWGYFVLADEEIRKSLKRDKWIYGILSVFMMIGCVYTCYTDLNLLSDMMLCILMICVRASRMIIPFAIIAFCDNEHINRKTKVLTYLNRANYPIYIYHMLLLTTVGYLILDTGFSVWIKFILINVITYALAFGIYECYYRILCAVKRKR